MRVSATRLQDSFATPRWLRDLGRSSWLLVGLLLLLLGLIWLLAETYTITGPMVCALDRHMPRAVGAALVLLAVAAIALFIVVIVVAGITGQSTEISAALSSGLHRVQGWMTEAGVDSKSASGAATTAKNAASGTVSTLVHGVVRGIRGLASVLFGLSLAALGTFFLLKDGQRMRHWVDRHVGLPEPVARIVTGSIITSLRGYF